MESKRISRRRFMGQAAGVTGGMLAGRAIQLEASAPGRTSLLKPPEYSRSALLRFIPYLL